MSQERSIDANTRGQVPMKHTWCSQAHISSMFCFYELWSFNQEKYCSNEIIENYENLKLDINIHKTNILMNSHPKVLTSLGKTLECSAR